MVKYHYPDLFHNDMEWYERAQRVSGKIFELTQFLVDVLGVDDVQASYHGKVTYHDSCHLLRGLGIKDQPRLLLENINGLQLVEMMDSEKCCGFGGAFALLHPKISSSMLEDKVKNILASEADTVVGCDISCLMNIEGMLKKRGLPIRVLHIAQILAST
jgi:L-lactate dehydrogenase complex protein LldE